MNIQAITSDQLRHEIARAKEQIKILEYTEDKKLANFQIARNKYSIKKLEENIKLYKKILIERGEDYE